MDLDPNSAANYAGQPQPGPGAYNAPQPVQQPYNPNSYAAAPPEPAPAPVNIVNIHLLSKMGDLSIKIQTMLVRGRSHIT